MSEPKAAVAKGTPLNLAKITDRDFAEALKTHHTDGQMKCIDHVLYRCVDGTWISTGEAC